MSRLHRLLQEAEEHQVVVEQGLEDVEHSTVPDSVGGAPAGVTIPVEATSQVPDRQVEVSSASAVAVMSSDLVQLEE